MSIEAIDVWDRLPFELAELLKADEFFCDIPVVVAEKGNVRLEMERLQAVITSKGGKRGVAVVVLQLMAEDAEAEVKFGPLILKPSFQVIENVELNNGPTGTKKSYRKVSRRVVTVIKAARLDGLTTDFILDKPGIEPVVFVDGSGKALPGVVGNHVHFLTFEADTEEMEQVSAPVVAKDGQTFTIYCATDGAVVWFTTDGTVPMPANTNPDSTAVVYSSPVAIPDDGAVVRAAGFKPGLVGSAVCWAEIVPS